MRGRDCFLLAGGAGMVLTTTAAGLVINLDVRITIWLSNDRYLVCLSAYLLINKSNRQ